MKKQLRKIVLLFLFALSLTSVQAQSARAPMEDVVNAIKMNRVEDMEKYFDNFVPITINSNQSVYSHNQTLVVLKDFFEKNNLRDFLVKDNGSPNPSSKFAIGVFTTPSGTRYNVYILMKLKDSSYMLQEIRLNKE